MNIVTIQFCAIIGFFSAALCLPLQAATPAVWNGGSGNWTTSTNWSTNPVYPDNAGGGTFGASMAAGTLSLDQPITIDSFSITGGAFTANNPLNLTEKLAVAGGAVNFEAGSALSTPLLQVSAGTLNFNQDVVLPDTQFSGGTIAGSGNITIPAGFAFSGGTFRGSGTTTLFGNHAISSNTAEFNSYRNIINTGGTLDWQSSRNLELRDTASFTNAADGTFLLHGAYIDGIRHQDRPNLFNNAGVFRQEAPGLISYIYVAFRNSGLLESLSGQLVFNAGYHQTAGSTNLRGLKFTTESDSNRIVIFEDGTVFGATTIDIPVINSAVISVGAPIGEIRVNNTLTLLNSSHLMIDIGGLSRLQYDSIYADHIDLAGLLDVRLVGGFESSISSSASFNVINTDSIPFATFNNIVNGRISTTDGLGSFRVVISNTGVTLTDFQAVPEPVAFLSVFVPTVICITRPRSR